MFCGIDSKIVKTCASLEHEVTIAAPLAVVRVEIVKHLKNVAVGELHLEAAFSRKRRFFNKPAIHPLALVSHQLATVVRDLPPPNPPALFAQIPLDLDGAGLLLVHHLVQPVVFLGAVQRVGEGLFGLGSDDEGVVLELLLVGIVGQQIVG